MFYLCRKYASVLCFMIATSFTVALPLDEYYDGQRTIENRQIETYCKLETTTIHIHKWYKPILVYTIFLS